MNKQVCILLAAYNGENYIRQMLNSIKEQSYKNFICYIHDDGSTDSTSRIIEEFCQTNMDRFVNIKTKPIGGAKDNFLYMLKEFGIKYPYIFFCDQDDIWLPDKIEKSLDKMIEIEGTDNKPTLVYSDMMVVDEELDIISSSFIKYNALNINNITVDRAIMKGYVAGCSMMLNNALANISSIDNTENIIMHDWWVMLIASAVGKIAFLDEALVLYRQHRNNVLGAKHITKYSRVFELIFRIFSGKAYAITRNGLYTRINQLARCSEIVLFKEKYPELVMGATKFRSSTKKHRCEFVLKNHLWQNKWSIIWTCICA